MICRFKVQCSEADNANVESGFVAGEDYNDCFSKIYDWYFMDGQLGSIEISMIPCVDEDGNIVALETNTTPYIETVYEDNAFNHAVPDYYDRDEDF